MFKVKIKLYRQLRRYFTPCSSVSIANSEYVIAGWVVTQLTFTCSRSIIETLEQGVKYVQN